MAVKAKWTHERLARLEAAGSAAGRGLWDLGNSGSIASVKLKDYVTLGSLVVALCSVVQSFEGHLALASVLVLLGWAFDAADGLIARLTHTGNAFGAQLDDLVDHFAYTVAPAFLVFNAYAAYDRWLALALLVVIVAIGTVRLARAATNPLHYPGYWIGLPRPAYGFMLIFLVNSSLFPQPGGPLIGVALVAVLGAMSLTRLPYRNHKRAFKRWQTFALVGTLLVCIALYPLGQMWNGALALGTIYLFAPLITLRSAERAEIARTLTGSSPRHGA